MVETIYRKFFLKLNHVWFLNKNHSLGNLKRANIYMLHDLKEVIESKKIINITEQHTLISNLSTDESELWKKLSGSHRNEIRRFERDGGTSVFYSAQDILKNTELIDEFQNTYNRMFESKGIKNTFNRALFMKYAKNNVIVMSIAYYMEVPIVFHSYIVDDTDARFWYSCSDYRNEPEAAKNIGRANRFLHWIDFLQLKRMGIQEYDWGGVDFQNPEIRGISLFKKSFGGYETVHYNMIISNTVIVKKIYQCIMKILGR